MPNGTNGAYGAISHLLCQLMCLIEVLCAWVAIACGGAIINTKRPVRVVPLVKSAADKWCVMSAIKCRIRACKAAAMAHR